jgi:hypothetical protein
MSSLPRLSVPRSFVLRDKQKAGLISEPNECTYISQRTLAHFFCDIGSIDEVPETLLYLPLSLSLSPPFTACHDRISSSRPLPSLHSAIPALTLGRRKMPTEIAADDADIAANNNRFARPTTGS